MILSLLISLALFLLSLIFLKFMVKCFHKRPSFLLFVYYIQFIVLEKLCWHFLKCRMNIHSSRRDLLLPLQGAWGDYWSGTTIDAKPRVPWTNQEISPGYRLAEESPYVYNVPGVCVFPLVCSSPNLVSIAWCLEWDGCPVPVLPSAWGCSSRDPTVQGASSVRLTLALVCPSVQVFWDRGVNALPAEQASVFRLEWFIFS